MLIATDTAERDIDIGDIYHVVNYDPHKETESYVHHIGRTGCMGAKGTAHSSMRRMNTTSSSEAPKGWLEGK